MRVLILQEAEALDRDLRRFDEHLTRGQDGTFTVNAKSGEEIGIDPATFFDLKRSVEMTNEEITSGKLKPDEVQFPLSPRQNADHPQP